MIYVNDFLGGLDVTEQSERYIVNPSRLMGVVNVSGAKNSALRLLAASLLTKQPVTLDNFPVSILDAKIHLDMLRRLGKQCLINGETVSILETSPMSYSLMWEGRSIRNTLLILGALLARFHEGAVPLPGGCDLGDRKFDLHELVFRELGADVWLEDRMLIARAKGRLQGRDIFLPIRSTGATENGIICASLAAGTTRIWNPHVRPEILDLIAFLVSMGAKIEVRGQECIKVEGVEELAGARHAVVSDNMEAITWLVGSVITNGDIEIINFPFGHLEVPLVFLRESGAKFYRGENSLIVRGGEPLPVEISTGPYPGINSDMQPLFAVFGLMSKGKSHIIDLRFPGRYRYAEELKKMGAKYRIDGNVLILEGGDPLSGTEVVATDLRAGIALILAGLAARGETTILNGYQIDRGYDRFEDKLRSLGCNVVKRS